MEQATVIKKQPRSKSKYSVLERVKNKFVTRSLTPIMAYMLFFSLLPMVWAVILGFFDYSPIRAGSGFLGSR